jgi:hypothetical protein
VRHSIAIVLASFIAISAWMAMAHAREDAAVEQPAAEDAHDRPTMQQLRPGSSRDKPPSSRNLIESRAELRRRFREPLSHADTAAGARLAAETLLTSAITEDNLSLKWVMLDEARRLGEAAGQAGIVSRAISLASGVFEFDAIDLELRCLKQIPLRGLDAQRAASVASAAEAVATRAEADQRLDKAADASLLAYRAWQRAGNKAAARQAAARQAATRHDAMNPAN